MTESRSRGPMTSIPDVTVTVQTASESVPSTPPWAFPLEYQLSGGVDAGVGSSLSRGYATSARSLIFPAHDHAHRRHPQQQADAGDIQHGGENIAVERRAPTGDDEQQRLDGTHPDQPARQRPGPKGQQGDGSNHETKCQQLVGI